MTNIMKKSILAVCALLFASILSAENYTISVQRIWEGDYCAFTSLEKFKGKYYCAFREGSAHYLDAQGNPTRGKARIIMSKDGKKWESVALFEIDSLDLRDPKLSIMPDGRMMVLMGGSTYEGKKVKNMYPQVAFTADGKVFTDLQPVQIDPAVCRNREWIWRVTWHNGTGYGVTYGSDYALLRTLDGINYSLVTRLAISNDPGETTLRFTQNGKMLLMARCEGGNKHGVWGESKAPYTQWTFKEMNIPLGGPDFCVKGDSMCILGSRSLYAAEKTMMFRGDMHGNFEESFLLPSGGDDNSYTGMLVMGKEVWVTYYSRHETDKASIYLARIPLSLLTKYRASKLYNQGF